MFNPLKWFRRPEKRSIYDNPAVPLFQAQVGAPSLAGVYLNQTTALGYSAYWAAVKIISTDAASLKLRPLQHRLDGGSSPATDHWTYDLMVHTPDGIRPSIRFYTTLYQNCLSWGNGYAEIVRVGKKWEGDSLLLLHPGHVTIHFTETSIEYHVHDRRGMRVVQPWNMIHLANPMSGDAIEGRSVINHARENLALGLAQDLAMAAFLGNAAQIGGTFECPPALDEQGQKNLREAINLMHGGPLNAGRYRVTPPGAKYTPDKLPAPDEFFLKNRYFSLQDCARWFTMPSQKLGDTTAPPLSESGERNYWRSGQSSGGQPRG